ncbi:MAG: hypothetical protein KGL19_15405 [Bacteroidota bacterium]|nr:hypothetical protein [Bacteroidota bacterium]
MKATILLTGTLLLLLQLANAQSKLSVIRSNSKLVDVKDGNELKKGTWTISPNLKPNIYKPTNKKNCYFL